MYRLVALMVIAFGSIATAQAARALAAPEIDPASAVSALTLLAGGLAVLRGRRGRK
jgi:hypothetical protein